MTLFRSISTFWRSLAETGRSLGDRHILTRVGQFHSLNGGIERHAIGSFRLDNMVFAQEQRLSHSLAVGPFRAS